MPVGAATYFADRGQSFAFAFWFMICKLNKSMGVSIVQSPQNDWNVVQHSASSRLTTLGPLVKT